MKLRIATITVMLFALVAIPAMAQNVIYDNGPIDGNTDGWTVNFGFVVSDSFTLESASTVNGLTFGAWLFAGDVLQSADISITSDEFGGTTFFSGTVNFTQSGCIGNGFGFNVCTESGTFGDVNLNAGTYWLNMQNAVVNTGDPVYWDENGGPSSASESSVGSIPSESFSIIGHTGGGGGGTTPEPSSVLLLGSGILGVAAVLRRKMF